MLIFQRLAPLPAPRRPAGWRTQRPFDSGALITAPRGSCCCAAEICVSSYAGASRTNRGARGTGARAAVMVAPPTKDGGGLSGGYISFPPGSEEGRTEEDRGLKIHGTIKAKGGA